MGRLPNVFFVVEQKPHSQSHLFAEYLTVDL
jgi:hypothetical protein